MVEQLLTSGSGGQEKHIASDQRVEIARMRRMLLSLTG